MATGAVVGIQDMGAAGLACCTSEMPARSGTGMEVELSAVPQRETEMTPYELLLSESQERMLLVGARGRDEELRCVFAKWELDAVKIGEVTAGPELVVRHRGEPVARVPVDALADGPRYDKPHAPPAWLDPALIPTLLPIGIKAAQIALRHRGMLLALVSSAAVGWAMLRERSEPESEEMPAAEQPAE